MIAIQTIKVNNKKRKAIVIHRGDCGLLDFTFQSGDEEYVMDETDTLELTVRKLPNSESPVLLHAVSAPGVPQIVLHTEDTQLEAGYYSADVQLNHGICRYTIWPEIDVEADVKPKENRKNFAVLVEVTTNE